MKDIVIKINVRIPIVSVVSFMVWRLFPSRSIYGAEFVKLFFSSTFPYQTHNKPNANKKNPLFSLRLKLNNPMTRAKVSNQGDIVKWCISLMIALVIKEFNRIKSRDKIVFIFLLQWDHGITCTKLTFLLLRYFFPF